MARNRIVTLNGRTFAVSQIKRVRRGTENVRLYFIDGTSLKVSMADYRSLYGLDVPQPFVPTKSEDIVGIARKGKNNLRVRLSNGATALLTWEQYHNIMSSHKVRTFGVELEFIINASDLPRFLRQVRQKGVEVEDFSRAYNTRGINKWLVAYDGSLAPAHAGYRGLELKSPVLRLDSPRDFADLTTVVTTLEECGATVNRSCGFHVHFGGFSERLSRDALERIRCGYHFDERFFDSVVAPSRRGNRNRYCKSVVHPASDRYQKLNVVCYSNLKTVEFRQHHGTVDIAKVCGWIHLCHAFLERGFKSNFDFVAEDFDSWLASLQAESEYRFTEFFRGRREALSA